MLTTLRTHDGGGMTTLLRLGVGALLLNSVVLAGCASGPAPSPAPGAMAECERSGGVWFAGPGQCLRPGGGGGM